MADIKKLGVYTSGGDAPGMNACIRSVVRSAIAEGIEVIGIRRGYEGMIERDLVRMDRYSVANIIQRGGTILKTARCEAFRTLEGRAEAAKILKEEGIDALVCIGGNGSYTGAMKLSEEHQIPVVGVPGTIDNDLYGTDFTIGYDTAINTALDAIDKIRDTADSHNRVFIVEVMGRDSGFIALAVGIAGGAEGVLIPEDTKDTSKLFKHFEKEDRRTKSFSIVVVAEGDETGGASAIEAELKKKYPNLDTKITILGHVQRGGSPTARDRILASRLGFEAVHSLISGYTDLAVGVVSDQVVLTPFSQAIMNRKSVSPQLVKMAEVLAQ